jgi:hypothetical protein
MNLEERLASLPVERWQTHQAIVFDWYDGPREGVGSLLRPGGEFFFELLDERPTADDLDDRLFRLSELPGGSVAEIRQALRELGDPTGPVWVPVWRFPTPTAREHAEQRLREVQARARPTSVVIATRDMVHFFGRWEVERTGNHEADWFARLRFPQPPGPAEEVR